MNLAKRLETLIKQTPNMTQAKLARLIGVKQQSISEIILGKTKRPRKIERIAEILDTTPEYLLFGVEENDIDELREEMPVYGTGPVKSKRTPIIDWQMALSTPYRKYMLNVLNDAMFSVSERPCFYAGMFLVVDTLLEPHNKSFVIAHEKGADEAIFRQYVKDGSDEILRALNPTYPTKIISDNMTILGVVMRLTMDID